MKDKIKKSITGLSSVLNAVKSGDMVSKIEQAISMIIKCLEEGGKVITVGNGGSAADAEHMAAELIGRFKKEREAMASISLTTNTSALTAIANDISYDIIFSRQLSGLASSEDILFAISTSGKSACIIEAVKKAKEMGLKVIALTGKGGGELAKICDLSMICPSSDTPRIQEIHILIIHIICELVEEELS